MLCVMLLSLVSADSARAPVSSDDRAYHQAREEYRLAIEWRRYVESDTRPSIGIAFGGGGARGMAHIGVLKSLEASGIPIDVVTGTSIGSFIGSLYASGTPVRKIEELGRKTNWSNLVELTLSKTGFFSTQRLENFMNYHLGNPLALRALVESSGTHDGARQIMFSDLALPFACTATDLFSGEVIRFDTGPVAAAVRASCSIPGLFEPVTRGERVLIDGGVVLNLPVLLCRDRGAEIVIAVDLEKSPPDEIGNLVQVLSQIIRIQGVALTSADRASANFLVEPAVGAISMTDLQKTPEAIREGEIAGHLAADKIRKSLLRWPMPTAMERPDAGDSATEFSPRQIISALTPTSATATTAVGSKTYLRAARAAVSLGLYSEALEYLDKVSDREGGREKAVLSALSAMRLRDVALSRRYTARLEEVDLLAADGVRLAAAAIDNRFDDLSDSILAMIKAVR